MGEPIEFMIWSDQWWIEDDVAWFVSGQTNILYEYNMMTSVTRLLSKVPNSSTMRENPTCMKCDDNIFCFPDKSFKLWIYSIMNKTWDAVELESNVEGRMACQYICSEDGKICFVSRTLCMIYFYDIRSRELYRYALKKNMDMDEKKQFQFLSNGICIGRKIYFAGMKSNILLSFNLDSKEVILKKLYHCNNIMRLQIVKEYFFLVGEYKEIYIWNSVDDSVKILDSIPANFGIYAKQQDGKYKRDYLCTKGEQPLFYVPIESKDYIWLIPWAGSEILLINKESMKLETFCMEIEDVDCLEECILPCKYVLNYVRKNRYLGLFSMKNRCQLEIDMFNGKIRYLRMEFNVTDWKAYFPLQENMQYRIDFLMKCMINTTITDGEYDMETIGKKIYCNLNK